MRNIGKAFPTGAIETHALAGIHLSVSEGEHVAIVGPTGCGKSTLLAVMGLVEAPTMGAYRLGSLDTASLTDAERVRIRKREIGWLFGAAALHADLSAGENVALALAERSGSFASPERVREALERVGLAGRIDDPVGWLSGGERQQVAVARATLEPPRLLLADEPTRNLDPSGVDAVLEAFRRFREAGTTICLATHDPRVAARADRVVELLDGRVVGDGCPLPPDPSRNPTAHEPRLGLEALSRQ